MTNYKVIQDIEAEDKLVGPLTLRQFIYAGVTVLFGYLSLTALTHGLAVLLIVLLPPMLFAGFFAIPWRGDQPTEVWALAKLQFYFKSRRRLWDQSGVKNLVTVTAPKKIEKQYTNGLSQPEVTNRLNALASTLDTRGWAIKNVFTSPIAQQASSDRLVDGSTMPQQVPAVDIRADEDMLDEQNNPQAQRLGQMVDEATASYKQRLRDQLRQGTPTLPAPQPLASGQWLMPPARSSGLPPSIPPADQVTEQRLSAELQQRRAQSRETVHEHTIIQPPTPPAAAQPAIVTVPRQNPAPAVTPPIDPATIQLAHNDDLNIATIARIAHKADQGASEVVIPLHKRSS